MQEVAALHQALRDGRVSSSSRLGAPGRHGLKILVPKVGSVYLQSPEGKKQTLCVFALGGHSPRRDGPKLGTRPPPSLEHLIRPREKGFLGLAGLAASGLMLRLRSYRVAAQEFECQPALSGSYKHRTRIT